MNIDGWQARVFFLTWAILSGSSASVAPLFQTSAFFQTLRSLSVSRLHSSYFVYYWSLQICNAGNSVNTLKGKRKWRMVEKTKGRKEEVVTREYTINLHKRLHGWYYFLLFSFWLWFFFFFYSSYISFCAIFAASRFKVYYLAIFIFVCK
jgi:small-conductance mechanosensitive channel